MEAINVLVTMPFPAPLIEKLANVSPRLNIIQHEAHIAEELPEDMETIDVLYASRALPAPEFAPRLRWVQMHSAGINHIVDEPLYTDTEVLFTTVSGIHAVNMAEYVVAQMLAFGHHVPAMVEDKRNKDWTSDRWERYVPSELRGKTLGIIGYGSIGREVARLAQAFGMQVLAIKQNVRNLTDDTFRLVGTGDPDADIPERIYPIQALHSFLGECDVVVVTVPLTADTHHLIDGAALKAMKKEALLINVARGDVVHEQALLKALLEGVIAGAGLDVFSEEPLPEDSPFWELPNVLMSPHVSGFTPHYDERATELFAENLRRFIVGEDLMNVVDRGKGY